jgi:hypothetical protein
VKYFVGKEDERAQAWKTVTIRIFNIGNGGKTTRKFHAAQGKVYSEADIDDLVERVAEDLERRLPQEEYSLVQVGPASFNFVWRGSRVPDAIQQPAEA